MSNNPQLTLEQIGKILGVMSDRGWRIATTPFNFSSRVVGNRVNISGEFKTYFVKDNVSKSKEAWQAEFLKVYTSLIREGVL